MDSGRRLVSWWRAKQQGDGLDTFTLSPRGTPSLEITAFYDTLEADGRTISVMGCFWESVFSRRRPDSGPNGALNPFIRNHFLSACLNPGPDGKPRGFGFKPVLAKLKGEDRHQQSFARQDATVELIEIGQTYEWVVYECDVFNFFQSIPLFRNRRRLTSMFPRIAAYDLIHEDYFSSLFPRRQDEVEESCFGYSFLPCPVVKSAFGYGPGQLEMAFKQFRFALLENGDLQVSMLFVSAPRSEKLLNLWGFDPVYGLIHLLDAITLGGLGIKRRAHDAIDAFLLVLHAQCYQDLIDGMRETWEGRNWLEPQPRQQT